MSQRPIPRERLAGLAGDEGLDSAQVSVRRQRYGSNDVVADVPAHAWQALLDAARDPMPWFLLATSALFLAVGDRFEAVVLLLAIVPLLGMDAWLHRRTQASTEGLASRLAADAQVLRDGAWQRLPARELVPGDLIGLDAGDWCPADALVLSGHDLQFDESSLSGESLPVRKQALAVADADAAAPGHWALAGTRLLSGSARLRVVETGRDTRYGEIAALARAGGRARTPLQLAVARLVRAMVYAAIALCLLLAGVRLTQGHGALDALLSALTLAVAALPEEFPVVLTVFLGVGVFRLARRKALVRRAVAVENIGRVSALCTDKTGTLTEGHLVLSGCEPSPDMDAEGLLALVAASLREDSVDPVDLALAAATGARSGTRLGGVLFSEDRRREYALLRLPDGSRLGVLKGAPETVLARCPIDPRSRDRWRDRVQALAGGGAKVIACARQPLAADADPALEPESGFEPVGLLAFADPLRAGVREAIQACLAAGIRVVMVTGDHPATAAAIAREVGLGGGRPAVVTADGESGPALATLTDADVVARASPGYKLALVQALQEAGHTVAVTGDGVNDVPALQAADIGIAMGERGTRPAREVADIVLLDDDFGTLVGAVGEGRQLFRNLQLAFVYLLLVHVPFVASAALVPLLGQPLLFLPIHVVWLELVIHPTALLAFQQAAGALPAGQPPVSGRHLLLPRGTLARLVLAGAVATAVVVSAYRLGLAGAGPLSGEATSVDGARGLALATLLLAFAGYLVLLTGWRARETRRLVLATLASLALAQAPAASGLLKVQALSPGQWLLALLLATVALLAALPMLALLGRGRDPAATAAHGRPTGTD